MKILDISMEIGTHMIVYPGNKAPKITQIARKPQASSNLSLITLGSHTGTHVDTPKHIRNKGKGAESLALSSYYGKCKVLNLTKRKEITAADLKKFKINKNDIILFKTDNSLKKRKKFNKKFVYLTLDGAQYLSKKNIKTLGVDYLSVQQFHSGSNKVHKMCIDHFTLFEGLDLHNIKPGAYTFVGLPLKIPKIDGSPARALLIKS